VTEPFNVLQSYHDLESRINQLEALVLSRATGHRQEAPAPAPKATVTQGDLIDFTRYQVTAIHRDSSEVVLRALGFRGVSPHLRVRQGLYLARPPAVAHSWPTPKPPDPPPKDFKCPLAKETRAEFEQQGEFEKEEFFFSQELVSQYGGDYIDDDATIFKISAKDLYVLLKVIGYGRVSETLPHAFTRAQISSACIRAGLSAPELGVVRSKLEEIVAEELSHVPN
jgi:hypothetical protein